MRQNLWLGELGLFLLLSGCANVSTLQTARVLPLETMRVVGGGGYFQSSAVDSAVGSAFSGPTPSIKFPYLELGIRVGVAKNIDIGGKLTLPGELGVEGKYQFLDQKGWAVAAGLGVSYLGITSGSNSGSNNSSFSVSFLDIFVPLFVSYDFTESFALYLSPKLLIREQFNPSNSLPYAGGTGGFKLGDHWGLFLEASYLQDVKSGATDNITQVNGALFFGTATTYPESNREVASQPQPRRRKHP